MFKYLQTQTRSSKQLQLRLSTQPIGLAKAATPIRGMKSPAINLGIRETRRRPMYDVYGTSVGRLGVLHLNKEHRFNTLSPSFCQEVGRGIGSFYEDRLIRAIYVSPLEGKHWSNGTDFRTMLAMKKEGNYKRLGEYLEQLYQLQTQVAKTNKPIIAAAPGHAFNSGATLLATCGYPLMTTDSKMAFNECTFGFVPHSGATYYLSRLPNEFGTFLALTGLPIHGTDAAKVKLVDSILETTKLVDEDVADTVYSFGADPREFHNIRSHHADFFKQRYKSKASNRIESIHKRQDMNHMLDNRAINQAQIQSMEDIEIRSRKFMEAHERIPSSVADVDAFYNNYMRQEQKKNESESHTGYLANQGNELNDVTNFHYQRVYQPTMDYIKSHVGHLYQVDRTIAVQHQEMIARCFYSDSIQEIMDNLQKEGTPFAMECLEAMKRNSPLSMALALRMLREARNLDYVSCMNMEVKVASKMIEEPDFNIGVQQVLMSPKAERGQKHPNAANYSDKKIPKSLDKYFAGAHWAKDINIGAMKHALLPTRHFYSRFTDQVRLWINEESTHQEDLRQLFDIEAKEALLEQGIDVRDKALTMQSAREHLAAKLAQERRVEVEHERMIQMISDKKLRTIYFHGVDNEVEKLKKMKKGTFQSKIDKCIKNVFERAYVDRVQHIYDKSREAQSLDRRRMFIKLKKYLFRSRCTTVGNESHKQQLARLENYPYKFPHLSEAWDKSWRDVDHPLIEKSPLFHLSKAIGRAQISPVELTREYLTNPQAIKQLSMLTVDKEELKKIQEDIFNNPIKYKTMFTKPEPLDHGQNRFLWDSARKERYLDRLSDTQFWHNMLNDGTQAGENWPFYQKFHDYKEWFDQVEDRALNTLKVAVNQLLADFDDPSNKTYSGKKLTKRAQLEELLQSFEEHEEKTKEEKIKVKKKKKTRTLSSSKRSLDKISLLIDDVIKEDLNLKQLLAPDDSIKENDLVKFIQENTREQLIQMLEIFLIDKYGDIMGEGKLALKQRLANLMMPEGIQSDELHHQQLKLIDSYLLDESAKDTLKSALSLIKPAFLNYMHSLLLQSSQVLAEDLQVEQTHNFVILYNYMMRTNPNLSKSNTVERLLNYSKKRDNTESYFKAVSTQSPSFKERSLLNSFAVPETQTYLAKTPIEQQKADIEAQMKRQKATMALFKSNLAHQEEEFEEDALESLTQPFDGDPDDDVRQLKIFWSQQEESEFSMLDKIEEQSIQWLAKHKYEIENHFTLVDWLKIYAEAIQDYDLNMNVTLKMAKVEHGDNVNAEGLSQDEWNEKASLARYISNLRDSLAKVKLDDFNSDLQTQFAQQSQGEDEEKSLWSLALSAKKQLAETESQMRRADRSKLLEQSIADFNEIQKQAEKRAIQVDRLERLANSKKPQVKDLINEAITTPNTFIDYDKLARSLQDGVDPTVKGLQDYIDVSRLVQAIEGPQKQKLKKVLGSIINTKTDLYSLTAAEEATERDTSLSKVEKAQNLRLLNHCKKQLEFLSNDERSRISVGRFLAERDLSSATPTALRNNLNKLLQQKITKAIGEGIDLEDSDSRNTVIDWDSKGIRTSPIDHIKTESSEIDSTMSFQLKEILNNRESKKSEDEIITTLSGATETSEKVSVRDQALIQVLREAKNLTKLTDDMEQYKNYYENKLLEAMMTIEGSQQQILERQQEVIDQYMSLRLRTCMLNANFSEKVRSSDNGHYYLKVLKERVLDELKLTKDVEIDDMLFKTMYEKGPSLLKYDIESAHNMLDINNTQALGYDRLSERSGAVDDPRSYDSAHQNVFDKLLANYYLSQRSEYAESNKLIDQLTDVFEAKLKEQKETRFALGHRSQNLSIYKQKQDMEKEESPIILAHQAKSIFELDMLTHRAIQGGKSGLSEELRALSIADTEHPKHWTTQIPEHFDWMDVRLKPEKYVKNKLQEVVDEAFQTRLQLEKNMTRNELLALDKVLTKYLEPEQLLKRLQESIESDYANISQTRQIFEHAKQQESSSYHRKTQEPNKQRQFNKQIKDEDALYKSLTMNAILEVKNKEKLKNPDHITNEHLELKTNHHSFERFYLDQLEKDAMNEPRPINPDDYLPKKPLRLGEPTEYSNQSQRMDQFFEDHRLYTENKKELHDRTKLFYILEQFFEQSRTYPDKMSDAQSHMREYFADPENTFFFDKNKIS